MKNNQLLIGLLVCLAFILEECKVSDADQKTFSMVLHGDSKVANVHGKSLEDNPKVAIPGTQSNYSLMVIKPDPTIDYKIVGIIPDSDIDYKITIIDPESGKELGNLSRELGDALRKILRQRQKDSK
jgi:hypothetical protein